MDEHELDAVIQTVGIETIRLQNETLVYRILPPRPGSGDGYAISCNKHLQVGRYADIEAARWACHLDGHGIIDTAKLTSEAFTTEIDLMNAITSLVQLPMQALEKVYDALRPEDGGSIDAKFGILMWAAVLNTAKAVCLDHVRKYSGPGRIERDHLRQCLVTSETPAWF